MAKPSKAAGGAVGKRAKGATRKAAGGSRATKLVQQKPREAPKGATFGVMKGTIRVTGDIVGSPYARRAAARAMGPVAIWDGEPKRSSIEHDGVHDET